MCGSLIWKNKNRIRMCMTVFLRFLHSWGFFLWFYYKWLLHILLISKRFFSDSVWKIGKNAKAGREWVTYNWWCSQVCNEELSTWTKEVVFRCCDSWTPRSILQHPWIIPPTHSVLPPSSWLSMRIPLSICTTLGERLRMSRCALVTGEYVFLVL